MKLKSKCIKQFNITPDTLNLIEEKVGNCLEHIGSGDNFPNRTFITRALSPTINKLKSFWKAKDTINRIKHQTTEWEKIFNNPTSDRGLISKIYKELKKLDTNKPNNPTKKWGTELNREFSTE